MKTDSKSKVKRSKSPAGTTGLNKKSSPEPENYYSRLREMQNSEAQNASEHMEPIEEDFERLLHETDATGSQNAEDEENYYHSLGGSHYHGHGEGK